MRSLCAATALLCVLAPLGAVETRYWEQGEESDFQKGTLSKLSLSSEGRLTTAPVLKEVYDASATFLWAVARDSKGNLYAGGGSVGGARSKLIAVDPSGKAKLLAELDGIAVQALAIDRQDRLYAATSPDGMVYRVDSSGKAEVFYDPHTKYIWAMAFSSRGDLFVATGDQGEIHCVTPGGAGSVFYRTEETHVRSLAIDAKNNVIAGTDPSGLILRISPAGEGFVLYEAPKREVTALAVAPDDTVYASAVGNKQAVSAPTPPAAPAARTVQTSQAAGASAAPAAPMGGAPGGSPGIAGGSEIYRIQPDGYTRR